MSDLINETFKRHLTLLKKKLNDSNLINSNLNEAEAKQLNLFALKPAKRKPAKPEPAKPDVYNPSDISNDTKKDFWDDYKAMSVKSFVDKYGKLFTDKKFHAFISAGVADGINDENFMVTPVSPLVTELTPTQNEIGFGNSLNDLIKPTFDEGVQLEELDTILKGNNVQLGAKGGPVPIVIFNKKYIIDGHHRWSKIYCANKTATVSCLNFENENLKDDPKLALKAFHLAIAKMLRSSPTEDKSGKNLFKSNKDEVFKYVYEYLLSPDNKFLDVYKKHSNLINEAEQLDLIDPKTTVNSKTLKNIDPFRRKVSEHIANNAQSLISSNKPATDTPRSHMPQTDKAPGYEDALKNGEINFLPDPDPDKKMVNETFQRHIKLLHKKLNLKEVKYYDAKILGNGD